ncbi:MAG: hypothetical protein IPK13_22160 [Deltaproteobacteria bacterium]|nr:hypothetical protein [Deltaproteobacteria bacterium]
MIVGLGVLSAAAVALGVYATLSEPSESAGPERTKLGTVGSTEKTASRMSDEERMAYLDQNVTLGGLEASPKFAPDGKTPAPGLLDVKGEIENRGEETLDRLTIMILPLDDDGQVMGAYPENITRASPLGAHEKRAFNLVIPAREGFSGRLRHKLQ